ncbi:MAG: transcription termination factor NusA [Candidatus Magasanikbacteria bacterium]
MDLKKLSSAMKQIAHNRGISEDKVNKAIESALASAYKKEYRSDSEKVDADFDPETGEVEFYLEKEVVRPEEVWIPGDDSEEDKEKKEEKLGRKVKRYDDNRHILLEEAQEEKPEAESGDKIRFPLETKEEFGRIASQTAKQVIIQKVREAERDSIKEEYKKKEGQIVSGVVQRKEKGHVYVDLDRTMGIMFENESIPGEKYDSGQRLRFYVMSVQEETKKRPGVILSRAHPKFVVRLFELEVPEIAEDTVEIEKIAREAGSRTKIAVSSNEEGIDPVGSAVGQRGARIMAVINELGNEKIDVVEYSEEPKEYIANAMSPAKVKLVEIESSRKATVLVEEDQLSLAIGKGGQNVRLAAKLTGWKIDVKSQEEPDEVVESVGAEEQEPQKEENEKTDQEKEGQEEEEKEREDLNVEDSEE